MKIRITLDPDKVRAMCIKHDYCDCCDCDAYAAMLRQCEKAEGAAAITKIVEKIADFSDVEKMARETFMTEDEVIKSIAFNLLNDCAILLVD